MVMNWAEPSLRSGPGRHARARSDALCRGRAENSYCPDAVSEVTVPLMGRCQEETSGARGIGVHPPNRARSWGTRHRGWKCPVKLT